MALGLLGRKVGMTQIFVESGEVVPVTVVEAGPCTVLQLRTKERDGYEAVQLGYGALPRRNASRSRRGQVANLEGKRAKARAATGAPAADKAGCEPPRFIREFRGSAEGVAVGQVVGVSLFDGVKAVDVIGTTKGRGTAGVIKRWRFHGQRATHGVKKVHRHAGSTGCNTSPGRTFPGRRMGGRYGAEQVTARNLRVVRVDAENNLLLLHGAVPGPNGGLVVVRTTNKV